MGERFYTKNTVEASIRSALDRMTNKGKGMYAPLVERWPIVMHNVPKVAMNAMKSMSAPATTDGNYVYIDLDEMTNLANWLLDEYNTGKYHGYLDLISELTLILCHEYTHLLCQHNRQGQEFNATHNDDDINTFTIACEIEANRGYMIDRNCILYQSYAVSDYHFPETVHDKYLPQIYETLKKKYGNNLNNVMNGNSDSSDEGDGDKSGSEGNSKAQEGQKGEKGNVTGQKSQNGSQGQKKGNEGNSDDSGEGKVSKMQRSVIERMRKSDIAMAKSRMTGNDLLPHDERPSQGMGGDDEGYMSLDPVGELQKVYKDWKKKFIKEELGKLKGIIEGSVSKERVKTYSRQSRKQGNDGLMMKGSKRSARSCPTILLAMDSSGSMDVTSMNDVASAIAEIFDTCGRPTKGCYICKHTSRVSDVRPLKEWKIVAKSFYASGGNNFVNVMEKALELDVDVVLNVGDGWDYCIGWTRTDKGSNPIDVAQECVKRGLRWYDVNIVEGSREDYEGCIRREKEFCDEKGCVRMERHWIDLTGGVIYDYRKDVR